MQAKKVAAVADWLRISISSGRGVLLLTGPPGSGKSTTVKLLAAEQDYDVCEWITPTPTTWAENLYHENSGVPYESKMDAFEGFINRAAHLPSLPLVPTAPGALPQLPSAHSANSSRVNHPSSNGSDERKRSRGGRRRIVLVDDLPHAHDNAQRARLCTSLQEMVAQSRCPCVIIGTTPPGIQIIIIMTVKVRFHVYLVSSVVCVPRLPTPPFWVHLTVTVAELVNSESPVNNSCTC